MKILIVDDHQQIREIIKKLISKLPFKTDIFECGDGDKSIEIYQKEKPDLILMDLMMKRLDGFTTIRRIRLLSRDTVIIVVSQLPEQEYKQESLSAGANDFLNKENLNQLPKLIENLFINKKDN